MIGNIREEDKGEAERQTDQQTDQSTNRRVVPRDIPVVPENHANHDKSDDRRDIPMESIQQTDLIQPELQRSSRVANPSVGTLQYKEYQQRETLGRLKGEEWATHAKTIFTSLSHDQDDYIACLTETKASHNIPHSYRHAMSTDPDRWIIPMKVEMDTLKAKHTWDLVKLPTGANVMDSMWVYDIKWDGEGN